MRAAFVACAIAVGMLVGVAGTQTTKAQHGPSNRCYGEITSGIASTWPWAHNDKDAFPPPPGALALWIHEFGPDLGIESVRDLQILFCTE